MQLPEYSGPAFEFHPPFEFTNVTVTVFPLRAELDTLQRFCASYLNIAPPEVGYFRPALPYVYLLLLDYGKLAAQVTNLGCFSQREALFAIPLEWYKWDGERLVFHDWATVSPFIYVDDPISMAVGRTVMGWPKTLMNLTPRLTGWIKDPSGTTTDIAISASAFAKAYVGARSEDAMFLRVSSPMRSAFKVPLDMDGPFMPWAFWSKLAKNVSNFGFDYWLTLQATGVWPLNETSDPQNLARKFELAMRGAGQSLPWAPNLLSNSINLKQFRRADRPDDYCYQALTNGPLRYTALTGGGLLGGVDFDPSGGYVIDVACWPNFPVVGALGLRADKYGIAGGPDIARIEPVFPFWFEANMAYERTQTLAYRSEDGRWRDGEGHAIAGAAAYDHNLNFNTVMGAASPVITGPFRFEGSMLRTLPLPAERAKCQALLDTTFNLPLASLPGRQERIEVWSSEPESMFVYLVVADWRDVASETNSLGDWADVSLTLYVPIKHLVDGVTMSAGLFPAYTFTNGTVHTCTLSELYGVPAAESSIVSPSRPWQTTRGAQARTVLRVDTEFIPSLNEGQMVQTKTLLSIFEQARSRAAPPAEHAKVPSTLQARTPHQSGIMASSDARSRVEGLLAHEAPIYVYTMKQFRDVSRSQYACYQALVRIPHQLEVLQPPERMARALSVEIRDQTMVPIAASLGLCTREIRIADGAPLRIVAAVEPFVLRANIRMGNGQQLYSRAGMKWVEGDARSVVVADPNAGVIDSVGPQTLLESILSVEESEPWVDAPQHGRQA